MREKRRSCIQGLVLFRLVFYLCTVLAFNITEEILHAQMICGEPAPSIDALLEQAQRTCSPRAIYELGATYGSEAIPALRSFANRMPANCGVGFTRAVRATLAKLGEQDALNRVSKDFNTRERDSEALRDLELIGDDRAMAILMSYFEKHASEPWYVDRGDYSTESKLAWITWAIEYIAARRQINLPVLPRERREQEVKRIWLNWWNTHKGTQLTRAPFESVSDPYLKCLARKLDWAIPEAALTMADQRGAAALDTLKMFRFPHRGDPLTSFRGALSAALAKAGDKEQFAMIESMFTHDLGSPSNRAIALEKIVYVGGKDAVGLLINSLRPGDEDVFGILPKMVKNPPLTPDAQPTEENIGIWKSWWAANKETVVFLNAMPVARE